MRLRLLTLAAATTAMMALPIGHAHATDVEDPWLLRLRALSVMPDEGGEIDPIGGDVDIKNQIVPELDISYFVKENVAFELILTTTPHDTAALNTSIGDVELGDVWLLPPTLLA